MPACRPHVAEALAEEQAFGEEAVCGMVLYYLILSRILNLLFLKYRSCFI